MFDFVNSLSFWIFVVIVFALIYKWWKKPHPNFPPLIRGFPGLGVIPYLDNYPQRIFKKWSLEMQEPVIAVRIGNQNTVLLNNYAVAHEAVSQQSLKCAGRPDVYLFNQVGNKCGIGFQDLDETYKKLKHFVVRFMKKGFGTAKDAMETTINEEADIFISELKKHMNQPGGLDLRSFASRLSFNVISKVITGRHFEYDDPQMMRNIKRITYILSETEDAPKLTQLIIMPKLRYIPSYRKINEKAKQCMKLMFSDLIDPFIEEHRKSFDSENIRDIIDEFLYEQQFGLRKEEEAFSDEQLRLLLRDLFMAGTDTTASNISWIVLCYLHHPEYHQLLQKEIDQVIDDQSRVTSSIKEKLPFISAFLQEVARFRSSTAWFLRKTKQQVKVGGYTIPAETTVAANVMGIQHDPDTWPDPDKFDPYRHIDENGQFIFSNKILIFGLGYRACLGENLARRELLIVFVKLLQAFHITTDPKKLPSLDHGHNNLTHTPLTYNVILSSR